MASVNGDQRRQRLVVHLDSVGALAGRLQGLAEHPANGVPVEHHLAGKQWFVVLLAGVVQPGTSAAVSTLMTPGTR